MSRQAKKTMNIGAAFVMIVGVVIAIVWMLGPTTSHPAQAVSVEQEVPVAMNSAVRLVQLGFDAPMLAAGGANAAVAMAARSRLTALHVELENLAELEAAQTATERIVRVIRSKIREGGATPDRLAALHEASMALATHRAERLETSEYLRADIFDMLSNQLGADGVMICERFYSNRHRVIPDRFKALVLSDSEWRTLECASLKQSTDQGLDAQEASLLNQCEQSSVTALVSSRLTMNESTISAAIDGMIVAEQ